MPSLSKRVSGFTESVIRRMTRISDAYGAINLSQGFPDFDPPKEMMDALAEIAYQGPHQYAVTFGAEDFREALVKKHQMFSGISYDPQKEVVVTCGGTEAMVCAMMAVCNPGDKVVVFSPFYENYAADAILSGAVPLYVPLVPPDFHIDAEALEAAFRQKPKAIIICNPSNPCGKVFTRDELIMIGKLALTYDSFVITDEVYEHIVFAPHEHVHFAALPGMRDRAITCSSLSKTYSITGWRLGYLLASPEVTEAARKVHDFLTIGAAAPLQAAAIPGLRFGMDYYQDMQALYTQKRDYFLQGLDGLGLSHNDPQGSYFVLVDISDLLKQLRFEGMNDLAFCEWMIKEIGVAAVPGSSFFKESGSQYIRLHFARSEKTLGEALKRLGKLVV
ncbi:MAG: pyridoxal phosphate-dependent aminotransferase [Clostridiales bacterium]|nr:pyridoxal phosphate-dependent aminotransferase [Clostridiales bacterium]